MKNVFDMLSDENNDQTIYRFTFTKKCIYLYLYVSTYICVCMYMYMYVCIYIYHNMLTIVIFSGKSMDSFFFLICAMYWVGQKIRLGFSIAYNGKTQMNLSASPTFYTFNRFNHLVISWAERTKSPIQGVYSDPEYSRRYARPPRSPTVSGYK